ncbi:putative major facilitator, sugar transporter, major facilitator superfamily [Helianthus annuus]|uniref:Major facilitator, sugar transporter, major facilitator superfamily n=1 Tax=Helianthus annuus TaxID=4232 RepID=A0A251UMI7_HELAN|nr:sugar transport protein 8 [Helianthus annuus]KAF5804611.1 putative major facilitator, sugar transporter, major facilitator superfamily [Helianthus annuus]KAJ0569211.1 putative sugar transport protein STP/MST-like, plant [Helianthus annuus]KAJ0575624.1 putative major facilitator, sugar transporter, major facilitator superfamily [Helianthus annuus]KAJ0583507.1 putative sugar/inositol transporter, major facilitator, sugar transporter [Helianthus annuus]KAJ0746242.1 putative major facilitator, 
MAHQVIAANGGADLPAKLTGQVLVCSIIAAFGGLMFGYDIGISGGVTSMDEFLKKFFPDVYVKKHHVKEDNYCKFDDQILQLFTSSLYLAAVASSFGASKCCNNYGRKITIQLASFFFLVGVVLNAAALNIAMLITGRLMLGAGIGFGNQAVPLFISEIAPNKYRGGLNVCFQLLVTVGILAANIVNYFTASHPYGWRISLGGASVPALFLAFGSLLIVETPTSLIERGHPERGLATLRKIRGVEDVQKEFDEIVNTTELAKQIKHPFKNLMKRSSWPQLITSGVLQIFQQFTGINVIMFYAPVLFQTMGFHSDASLLSAVVTGTINTMATLVAVFCVDKLGRRFLLIEAAIQMFIAQVVTGGILAAFLKSTNTLPKQYAYLVLLLICVFVSGFAWSWGPLGWLIPSEIFPLETRTAGFFCAVSMNMIFTFIIAQAFLTMLCHMRAMIFFFFSGWIVIMGLYAYALLPETKGVSIDEMNEKVWKKHWLWKRCFKNESEQSREDKP